MAQKRLLISLAHPDDESFGSGGLIAKYVSEGVEVFYICATRGNRGTVAPEFLEKHGSIDAVRDAELECASQVLGFKKVYKLGYGDSGMMGSPENDDPDCLWQADEGVVTGQIAEIMREVQPQVITTFDPYGGYGHPDHIFVHRATTRAFHDLRQNGSGYRPQKLYYGAFPKNLMRFFLLMMRLRGEDPRHAGANKDMDFTQVLENAKHATTLIPIAPWFEAWAKASDCHASQGSWRGGYAGWLQKLLWRNQGMLRAYPEARPGEKIERDLFTGVNW